MAGSVVMQLSGVDIGYSQGPAKKVLIQNLNLTIRRGEVVCLLGQNGVGKSTLLRTLAGMQPPLGGSILLDGLDTAKLSAQEMAFRVSVVLTERLAAANVTVYDLVALGRHPYTNWLGILTASDRQKVEEALTLTKLNYLADSRLSELSDGQYQKAMIARAVAQNGELMLLDEPTAFLDLNNSVEIFLLLTRLAREQSKAIVISTHDFHLAMQFADRLWLTNFNTPLYEGLPEDLGLNGQLEENMFHEGFGLDLLTGRIVLPSSQKGTIRLSGSSPAHQWTRRALERRGFATSEEQGEDLQVFDKKKRHYWQIGERTFPSIHELLQYLEERAAQKES